MIDVARRRENLQDIETMKRLREMKTKASVVLAGELDIAICLRDAAERCGADATLILARLREKRNAAAKLLYEEKKRLIALPRRHVPFLRLVAP